MINSEHNRILLEGILTIICQHAKENYKKINIFHAIVIYWTARIIIFCIPYFKDSIVNFLLDGTGLRMKFNSIVYNCLMSLQVNRIQSGKEEINNLLNDITLIE